MTQLPSTSHPGNLGDEAFSTFGQVVSTPTGHPSAENDDLTYYSKVFQWVRNEGISVGMMECKLRQPQLLQMERHSKTAELLVNLGEDCVMAVAPPSISDSPNEEQISTFIFPKGVAVVLHSGVWHWAPFPVANTSQFLVGFLTGTEEEDLLVRPLSSGLNVLMP